MRRTSTTLLAFALLAFSLNPSGISAEELKSQFGFYLDLPSGFQLKDGDGQARFSFVDPKEVMELDIVAYAPGRFADVAAMAKANLDKLGSKGEVTPYTYEGRKAILAELNFSAGGGASKGYGLFIGGRRAAKGEGSKDERDYLLLAYSPSDKFDDYADFILSCLDSFSVDRAALRAPGPVSQFTLDWPPLEDKSREVSLIGDQKASIPWSEDEAKQETDTIGREYRVLNAYAGAEGLWQDAWARFYRMSYRESAARLDRLSLEFSRILAGKDDTERAREVLAWTQGFVYEKPSEGPGFEAPLLSAYDKRGDCDSRSVVAAIILKRLGIDSILMVSQAYAHAILGVDVPGGGQRFAFSGKNYLVGETTAKVGLGMIAADQADWSKWMGIRLDE